MTVGVTACVSVALGWLVCVDGLVLGHGDDVLGNGNDLLDDDNLDNLVVSNGLVKSSGDLLSITKRDWSSDWSWSDLSLSWSLLLNDWGSWGLWSLLWRLSDGLWSLGNWLDLGDLVDSLWSGSHSLSILWSRSVWRVAWKGAEWSREILRRSQAAGKEALLSIAARLDVENWAVLDPTGHVGTCIDSSLEGDWVPSGDEISVVSVAGWVTVGPDELAVDALESVGVPLGLVHQAWKTNWELWWAGSGHDIRWVSDVGLVGRATVQVLTVPAGWEHQLGANAVLAVGIGELLGWHLVTAEGWLWVAASIVNAVKAEGAGLLGVGLVAKGGLSSDHGEALWESLDSSNTLLSWVVVEEVIAGDLLAGAQ